jgi:hypothetical protein
MINDKSQSFIFWLFKNLIFRRPVLPEVSPI